MVLRIRGTRLGIVGGLGTETSCGFCLSLNTRLRRITNCQPNIVMENVPVPISLETSIIKGDPDRAMFDLLARAVTNLNDASSDLIVIPCNTVHVFIDELRSVSKKPILSIIEECAKECSDSGFRKVGLLATSTTVKQALHHKELAKKNIEVVLPKNQSFVSEVILRILGNTTKISDKIFLLSCINELKLFGAEAVILGCTDLDLLISEEESSLPLIDTTKVLEDVLVKLLS